MKVKNTLANILIGTVLAISPVLSSPTIANESNSPTLIYGYDSNGNPLIAQDNNDNTMNITLYQTPSSGYFIKNVQQYFLYKELGTRFKAETPQALRQKYQMPYFNEQNLKFRGLRNTPFKLESGVQYFLDSKNISKYGPKLIDETSLENYLYEIKQAQSVKTGKSSEFVDMSQCYDKKTLLEQVNCVTSQVDNGLPFSNQ